MNTHIALLRGINVGGHKKIKMAELRELCQSIGFERASTLLQSGNLVFRSKGSDRKRLEKRLADAIEAHFGFRCGVLVIEPDRLREAIGAMPFDAESLAPNLLAVVFLDRAPTPEGRKKLRAACSGPEEVEFGKQNLYVYYPQGSGRSRFTLVVMEKALDATGTVRNWNTTNKLLALADQVEDG